MQRITANVRDYGLFERFKAEKSKESKLAIMNFNQGIHLTEDETDLPERDYPVSNSHLNFLILLKNVLVKARRQRHRNLIE